MFFIFYPHYDITNGILLKVPNFRPFLVHFHPHYRLNVCTFLLSSSNRAQHFLMNFSMFSLLSQVSQCFIPLMNFCLFSFHFYHSERVYLFSIFNNIHVMLQNCFLVWTSYGRTHILLLTPWKTNCHIGNKSLCKSKEVTIQVC